MKKIFTVEKYEGIIRAEVKGTILMIREGEYNRRGFELTKGGKKIWTLKNAEWDNTEAEEVTRYETKEEAEKALEELETDSYFSRNSETISYTYYKLQEALEDEEGEIIESEEVYTVVDNSELIEEVREYVRDNEMEENDDYLTNLFGEERIASKKEIMEDDRYSNLFWEEIVEDVNSDELAYYIAEEDFDFENYELEKDYLKADVKGWIAGDFYNFVNWETGLRIGTETKDTNIIYNTGGNGGVSNRVGLPSAWVNALGVTREDREVRLEFKGDKIIISKK